MYVNGTFFEPSQAFAYEIKGNSAVILRCFSRDSRAEIPERLDGYPVTELGSYAFSSHMDEKAFVAGIRMGKIKLYIPDMMEKKDSKETGALFPDAPVLAGIALEEIVLPRTIVRIGRYCFYNCTCLRKMTFFGMLQDWGSGAFTGVHHVKEMVVTTDSEGKTTLKQILEEIHEEISVTYFDEKGRESHVVFPEFFEEGVENTPAKLHEIRIHGSGMMYRNCITQRRLDFRQYDSLFDHAGFLETTNMTIRLAVGRLRYPVELSDAARIQYEAYVFGHGPEAADLFLEEKDLEGLKWQLELYDKREKALEHAEEKEKVKQQQTVILRYMMEATSRLHFTEATGFLMNYGRTEKRPARRRMEL